MLQVKCSIILSVRTPPAFNHRRLRLPALSDCEVGDSLQKPISTRHVKSFITRHWQFPAGIIKMRK